MRKILMPIIGALLLHMGFADDAFARGRGSGGFRGGGGFHGAGVVGRGPVGRGFVGPGFGVHFRPAFGIRATRFGYGPWIRRGGPAVGIAGDSAEYGYEDGYGYYDCELGSRLVWNGQFWVTIC